MYIKSISLWPGFQSILDVIWKDTAFEEREEEELGDVVAYFFEPFDGGFVAEWEDVHVVDFVEIWGERVRFGEGERVIWSCGFVEDSVG